jgi:hypothetical protein
MHKRLTVATGNEAEAINTLRTSEYTGTKGFAVQPPGILWNRSDDQALVLAAWEGDQAVGTLRMELIEDRALAEAKIECPWEFEVPFQGPVAVLGKMAVLRSHRKSGLNELLRWHALRVAQLWGAKIVSGTMVAASPRKAVMTEMGYRFFEHPEGWTSPFYKSSDPVLVVCLEADKIPQAMEVCQRLAGDTVAEFPWEGEIPERRLVEVMR